MKNVAVIKRLHPDTAKRKYNKKAVKQKLRTKEKKNESMRGLSCCFGIR